LKGTHVIIPRYSRESKLLYPKLYRKLPPDFVTGKFVLHEESKNQCRSTIIWQYVEQYPQLLKIIDEQGNLPLQSLLINRSATIDDSLLFIEKYPAALQHRNDIGDLPLHIESSYQCRSSIIAKCIQLYPKALAKTNADGIMPLHVLLGNRSSSMHDVLLLIERYPKALDHRNNRGDLPLHIESSYQCRSSIIAKCIQLYPKALAKANFASNLPMHLLLINRLSSIDDALLMIEKYPAALQHRNIFSDLPLHIECKYQCRSSIISKCTQECPEVLAKNDLRFNQPLHLLLGNISSTIDDALLMIEKYPATIQHRNGTGELPLHIECKYKCRSSIIAKCIQLYPEALAEANIANDLPLHLLFTNSSSSIDDALLMIKKYPAALQHRNNNEDSPVHIECKYRHRLHLIATCITLYPESLNERTIDIMIQYYCIDRDDYIRLSVLAIIFTARPTSSYKSDRYQGKYIRSNPDYRRRILHLLPRHVFTPTNEFDYRDLNWKPRSAMMMFLSQMKMKN
jgi:ankyrin repeat protein